MATWLATKWINVNKVFWTAINTYEILLEFRLKNFERIIFQSRFFCCFPIKNVCVLFFFFGSVRLNPEYFRSQENKTKVHKAMTTKSAQQALNFHKRIVYFLKPKMQKKTKQLLVEPGDAKQIFRICMFGTISAYEVHCTLNTYTWDLKKISTKLTRFRCIFIVKFLHFCMHLISFAWHVCSSLKFPTIAKTDDNAQAHTLTHFICICAGMSLCFC